MRTSVRWGRPWRMISWPAANGMRCVNPSRATVIPSRTCSALASRSSTGGRMPRGRVRCVMQLSRRWQVLAVTAVAVFMGFLDVTIVNVAFPDIERDFASASRADLSWVLNAYNIVFAALLVPAGRLADLLGRRRMFLVGVSALVASSALCGMAPSPGWLVGARVVQASAGAILVPTSLALLLREFPPERRATAGGGWGAARGGGGGRGARAGGHRGGDLEPDRRGPRGARAVAGRRAGR